MYSPISQVNITLALSGITAQGFGTALFIADVDTTTNPDPMGAGVRVKTYSTIEEVAADWDTTDAAYIAAQQFLAPNPSPSTFKIAYRDVDVANTETPAEALAAITAVDSDFYFVTAETHAAADVVAYATAIEATKRLYFFSTDDETALTAYDEGVSTDVLAQVKDGNYLRTKGFFHQAADTAFPECYWVAYNATFFAGSVSWENIRVNLPVSQDPTTSLPLSTAQKGYLEDRNAAYTERLGANTVIIRNARTAGGEWIDFIHGRDQLEEDMNAEVKDLLARQKGTKLPYDNGGITKIMNVVENVLARYATNPRNFIQPDYRLSFLMRNQVPVTDVEARVYRSGSFQARLTGVINRAEITGTLSLEL